MIAGTIVLEDITLTFILKDNAFEIMAFADGQESKTTTTYEELGALLALAVGSDEIPGADQLYPIAEDVCERLGMRLIP